MISQHNSDVTIRQFSCW